MEFTRESNIGEIINEYPESIEVFMNFGLGCVGCPSSQLDTIEDACLIHGIDVEELLEALNG